MDFLKRLRIKLGIKKKIKKLPATLFYTLPIISQYNPRKKITNFKGWCNEVESFPKDGAAASKNWYLAVRPPQHIQRKKPVSLDDYGTQRFFRSADIYQSGCEFTLPEVFISCLTNAKIYSKDFLILSDSNDIFYDSIWLRQGYLENNGILDKIRLPNPKHYSGAACVLGTLGADNYYHWMLDIMPRLSLLEQHEELQSIPLIVPKQLKPFQKESLQMAGVSSERIIEFDGSFCQVDKLYYLSSLGDTGNPSPYDVLSLRKLFLDKHAYSQPPSSEYLYITRRDAKYRRILEEQKLTEYLQSIGFEVVCLSDLSFAEQIQKFNRAKIIIAPHGAALANMVFAPENAQIIELFPEDYINGCFWALANVCRYNYAFLIGSSEKADFRVPLDKLKALLEKVVVLSN
jgi:Glycosyltransferase 61